MRTLNYEQMLQQYDLNELDKGDNASRFDLLQKYPFSILIEADHSELDSLNYWLKDDLGQETLNWLYYGKTGYDFGIAEYFFNSQETAKTVSEAVPRIFTTYPNAYPKNRISKSNGYNQETAYDKNEHSAIVIPPQEIE